MLPALLAAALAFAGQAAPDAAPAPPKPGFEPRRAEPPCPGCTLPRWLNARMFTRQDYPREARRARQQGWVRFRVTVTRRGRATNCVVVESSGSAALDRATCAILPVRARFTPARDAAGAAIEADYWSTVTWRL